MLEEILPDLDLVLVMTVNPGFGGQRFLAGTLPKIRTIRQMIDSLGTNCELEVDGGIDHKTAPLVVEAGARVLVAGFSIYGATDGVAAAMDRLRNLGGCQVRSPNRWQADRNTDTPTGENSLRSISPYAGFSLISCDSERFHPGSRLGLGLQLIEVGEPVASLLLVIVGEQAVGLRVARLLAKDLLGPAHFPRSIRGRTSRRVQFHRSLKVADGTFLFATFHGDDPQAVIGG